MNRSLTQGFSIALRRSVKRSISSIYNAYLVSRQKANLSGSRARSGLSMRGFWVGSFLCFFLAIGSPHANMAMSASNMSFDFNTPGAIFLFLFSLV